MLLLLVLLCAEIRVCCCCGCLCGCCCCCWRRWKWSLGAHTTPYGSSPPRLSEVCCCSQRDGWSCAQRQRTALRWVRGPPPLLLPWPRIRAAPRRSRSCAVCVGAGWGADSRAQAPTHRPHAFEAALAYPPWRWLTLPISGHPPSRRYWFTSYPCQRPSRDRGMPWDRPVSLELV